MIDLAGVFVPTATPFQPRSGDLDLSGFTANLEGLLSHPIRGLVIGGSTGEAVLLDESERLELLEVAHGTLTEADGDRLLIAGTGAESLRTTQRLTRSAADAGAAAVLVQPPAFYRGAMSESVLIDHYHAVADDSPVPVIVYQVPPKFSTLEFSTDLVATLSEHDNIVGIKDSRGQLGPLTEWVNATTDGFQVLVGSGAILLGALDAGAVGGILGVSNLMPGECAGIAAAAAAGDRATAESLQTRVAPVHIGVIGGMGVPGVKAALDRLGQVGGRPRPPLGPLAGARHQELDDLLSAAGIGAAVARG